MGRRKTNCACAELANAELREQNVELVLGGWNTAAGPLLDFARCVVAIKRRSLARHFAPTRLVASFCPFCGLKYLDNKKKKVRANG